MENFEQALTDLVQKKVLQDISKTSLVEVSYNERFKVPSSFLNEVYKALDLEKIRLRLIENLENEMADKIANKLITEYGNDIKQIMCNAELKEELRHYAREKIKAITDKISE
ncbi:MAG: hypothetical protein LLG05_18830 [Porphyromonadaceae bacterium]|nr:hypothetical protein [Porphyromonadaceae bacterium]